MGWLGEVVSPSQHFTHARLVRQTGRARTRWGLRRQATAQHVAQSWMPKPEPVIQAGAELDRESRQTERLQDDFEKAMWPERG